MYPSLSTKHAVTPAGTRTSSEFPYCSDGLKSMRTRTPRATAADARLVMVASAGWPGSGTSIWHTNAE